MYHVSSNPRTCAKLQQEIDEAARAGMLSPIVTYQEAQQLPYFQLVIKEALRLYVAGMWRTSHFITHSLAWNNA